MVHEHIEDAAGEAWDGGPVILSWEDAAVGRRLQRGDPRIRAQAGPAGRRRRRHALAGGASRHRAARLAPRAGRQPGTLHRGAGRGRSSHPADVDPESEEADAWYGQLPMDPTRRPTRPSSSPSAPSISSSTLAHARRAARMVCHAARLLPAGSRGAGMKPLLIVWHSRTGAARQMAEAAADALRPPPSWRRGRFRGHARAPPTPAWTICWPAAVSCSARPRTWPA